MDEPSSKLSEEDLGNEGTELCEAEPFKTEPRKAKKIPKGCCSCCSSRHSHRPSKNTESFASYFPRVLKQVHMGLSLSQEAMNVMTSFVMDMFGHIAKEAGHLACNNKHCTITPERFRPLCTCCCMGRCASIPCQRPPTWSSKIPPAERLTLTTRTLQTKSSFQSHSLGRKRPAALKSLAVCPTVHG